MTPETVLSNFIDLIGYGRLLGSSKQIIRCLYVKYKFTNYIIIFTIGILFSAKVLNS